MTINVVALGGVGLFSALHNTKEELVQEGQSVLQAEEQCKVNHQWKESPPSGTEDKGEPSSQQDAK